MFKKLLVGYIIIFFGLVLSILLSTYYIGLYDNYQLNQTVHIMLKEETFAHWEKAAKIIRQMNNGVPFFTSGEEMFTKPLHQRLVVLYSLLTNFNIFEDWESKKIALGGKSLFLITQSLIYYLCVFVFYKQIQKIFDQKINCLIVLIFMP